ncbi:DUF6768 family protein [Wenzhouxiangella limi]|uniref:Uncharacterized protein n=1 Tax=Wenzhouxiangella limi TaxID=2707351 RepID=A0A845V2F5_9GAMM|nr:DUF6768 family protein [Wenzhouxiangella limi]NDY96782.1 hypothetical protein [Wenzhouxiangella limi]
MSIDEKIRRELLQQGGPVEGLKAEETGLFPMLFRVFTGGLARWAGFAMALTLVAFSLMLWTGYAFFAAASVDDRVFWGVLVLAAFHALSMFKLWFFMEMNRHSVTREVKRVEIALARLEEQGEERP